MNALAFQPLPLPEQHRLVVANRGLAHHIARQFYGSMNTDDLVAWGYVGLVEAARRFDVTMGTKFSTFAVWWIRCLIMKALIKDSGTPDSVKGRAAYFGMRKAIREIERTGDTATDEALAAKMGLTVEATTMLRGRIMQSDVHIDALPPEMSLHGQLASNDDPEATVMERHDGESLAEEMRACLERLPPRERRIIRRRHLIENPATLQEVADDLGLSRERVRQLEVRAMGRLKRMMARKRKEAR